MIIIEIILTIFAWKNGWKWLSLIPVCAAFGIGFIIGLTNPNIDLMQVIWVDLIAIIALIVMLIKKKED